MKIINSLSVLTRILIWLHPNFLLLEENHSTFSLFIGFPFSLTLVITVHYVSGLWLQFHVDYKLALILLENKFSKHSHIFIMVVTKNAVTHLWEMLFIPPFEKLWVAWMRHHTHAPSLSQQSLIVLPSSIFQCLCTLF